MDDGLLWHRIQFAFSVSFHYLFPQLTMGLALLIVVFKTLALRTHNERYNEVARFRIRIFGLNFAMGVVTGIPLEFQFGTNWARFSKYAGEVIGHTLALEGLFAFFLESTFLGLLLYGERRLGPKGHLAAAIALATGTWMSGYLIIVANAFMQHPVGYVVGDDGALQLASVLEFLCNPWAFWQYAHTMTASMITASFVFAAVGAYRALMRTHVEHAAICLRVGVIGGLISCALVAFPFGDLSSTLRATMVLAVCGDGHRRRRRCLLFFEPTSAARGVFGVVRISVRIVGSHVVRELSVLASFDGRSGLRADG